MNGNVQKFSSRIGEPPSRQPLVKGERLVRNEVGSAIRGYTLNAYKTAPRMESDAPAIMIGLAPPIVFFAKRVPPNKNDIA